MTQPLSGISSEARLPLPDSSLIEIALVAIGENPQRWPLARRGTRKFILPNFPFSLIDRELPSKIQIVAIAHGKRRPDYWKDRL
jgi:toxin ParE1/3/4